MHLHNPHDHHFHHQHLPQQGLSPSNSSTAFSTSSFAFGCNGSAGSNNSSTGHNGQQHCLEPSMSGTLSVNGHPHHHHHHHIVLRSPARSRTNSFRSLRGSRSSSMESLSHRSSCCSSKRNSQTEPPPDFPQNPQLQILSAKVTSFVWYLIGLWLCLALLPVLLPLAALNRHFAIVAKLNSWIFQWFLCFFALPATLTVSFASFLFDIYHKEE